MQRCLAPRPELGTTEPTGDCQGVLGGGPEEKTLHFQNKAPPPSPPQGARWMVMVVASPWNLGWKGLKGPLSGDQ